MVGNLSQGVNCDVVDRTSYDRDTPSLADGCEKRGLRFGQRSVDFDFDGEEPSVFRPSDSVRTAGVADPIPDFAAPASTEPDVISKDSRSQFRGPQLDLARELGFRSHGPDGRVHAEQIQDNLSVV